MGYCKSLVESEKSKSPLVQVYIHYVVIGADGLVFRSRPIKMIDGGTCYTDKVLLSNVPKKECMYTGGLKPMVSYYSEEKDYPREEMLRVLHDGIEMDKEDEVRRFNGLLELVEEAQ